MGGHSGHVSPRVGGAVDIGHPMPRDGWPSTERSPPTTSSTTAAYGLCQIYGNEPWHYELRPDAIDHGCPSMYPAPAHDPRRQR